ncbi:MAG: FecR domain-containing protein [Rhodospirillum sp.]|nr:FecR domain-containing protein [Rhodospirillum sp.]
MTTDGRARDGVPASPREAALSWVIRLRAPDVPAHERRAFQAWLAEAPEHRSAHDQVQALWDSDALIQAARQTAPWMAPSPMSMPSPGKGEAFPKNHPHSHRWANMAAAALLCLASGLLLPDWDWGGDWVQGQWVQAFADHATAVGERRKVALPDGSTVTLDSDSAFDLAGTSQDPRVMLRRGAAYFEVTPRAPGHGFTVETPEAKITVVGTRFSVETDNGHTQVAVRHGTVETRAQRGTESGIRMERLTLGQGASVTAEGQLTRIIPSEDDFAWLDGRLTFHDQPFGVVLAELDRSFPGVILLANDRLAGIKISGSYRLDDPENIVRSLARITLATVTGISPYLLIVH